MLPPTLVSHCADDVELVLLRKSLKLIKVPFDGGVVFLQ